MKKSFVISIIFFSVLFSFLDMKVYGQEKRDSLDKPENRKFFNLSTSYCLPSIGQLGVGYNLKKGSHKINFTTNFAYQRDLSQNYYGFEVSVGYYFGSKFILTTSLNYMVLLNEKRSIEIPKPLGPPPNYHTVWQQLPNIELGVGYSVKSFAFTLTGKLINYSFSKRISFLGETYINENKGVIPLIIPCFNVIYNF